MYCGCGILYNKIKCEYEIIELRQASRAAPHHAWSGNCDHAKSEEMDGIGCAAHYVCLFFHNVQCRSAVAYLCRQELNGDTDNDGHISKAEADSIKSLNLTQYRTDMFVVSTYEDLAKFPNLEKLWLGESKLDTVDLSKNWNLKYVHIESDNLKTLILAVGCTPKLAYPMHSGELVIKRILNPDAPGAMFFQY